MAPYRALNFGQTFGPPHDRLLAPPREQLPPLPTPLGGGGFFMRTTKNRLAAVHCATRYSGRLIMRLNRVTT